MHSVSDGILYLHSLLSKLSNLSQIPRTQAIPIHRHIHIYRVGQQNLEYFEKLFFRIFLCAYYINLLSVSEWRIAESVLHLGSTISSQEDKRQRIAEILVTSMSTVYKLKTVIWMEKVSKPSREKEAKIKMGSCISKVSQIQNFDRPNGIREKIY